MIEWIKEAVAPPGIEKKNRGSLFSVLGKVFGVVRNDAQTALFARYPYLCDDAALNKHGKALFVPRLPGDTSEEYRLRVTAASYFLSKAGERVYVKGQLTGHFGDRYLLTEEFLQVYVKVLNLSDADRMWLWSFLDETLNPNVELTIADWFRYVERVVLGDQSLVSVITKDRDVYPRGLRYNSRIRHDHGFRQMFDGAATYGGGWLHNQFHPVVGTMLDEVAIPEQYQGSRTYGAEIDYIGSSLLLVPLTIPNPATYSSTGGDVLQAEVDVSLSDRATIVAHHDGRLLYQGLSYGSVQDAIIDTSMPFIVRHHRRFDGRMRYWCSPYDGLLRHDGVKSYYDGIFYEGDEFYREEVA
ncbi:hypothetical protein [Sediminispirochaeta bajacaliforniensis]|uniref:hypothetical protein n=1 Tax=Sediminispirochaeta bajacaliforniensis TaxID=148 RepID=UPI000378715C|nr:hypothetical protein [Sediminispirochaeta bajacaliforniensis]